MKRGHAYRGLHERPDGRGNRIELCEAIDAAYVRVTYTDPKGMMSIYSAMSAHVWKWSKYQLAGAIVTDWVRINRHVES
jgi:hypothetical protein